MFAVYGIRAMAWMGRFAVVSVTILAGWMIYSILSVVAAETGGNPLSSSIVGEPWTLGLGITASIGTFVVSATMTGDFCRWTKNPRQAWAVTAVAFPVGNLLMLMVGGLYTAVAGELDFFFGLSTLAMGIPIMIIQWASNGSTCDGCLYNASQGFKNVTYHLSRARLNFSWKKITLIVMIAGTAVAASNILTSIVPWLLLLGTVLPLVGGVLIGHFWIVARKSNIDEHLASADNKINLPAVIGFVVGLAIAVVIQTSIPDLPPAVGGLIGGIGVYPPVAKAMGYCKNGRLTPKALGTAGSYGTSGVVNKPHGPTSPGDSASTNASDNQATKDRRIQATIDKIVAFVAPYWSNSSSPSFKRS
jgi:cytosine permease